MEDMSQEIDDHVEALGELLQEHKGQDVTVLDLRAVNNWTDFFIIATVSSKTHMDGLERHVKDFCHENNIGISGNSRKKHAVNNVDDEWRLIDLGGIIIHLMTARIREFYELERLWRYSSKSSQSSSSSSSKSSSSSSSS
jgi:ribosome-associated protein